MESCYHVHVSTHKVSCSIIIILYQSLLQLEGLTEPGLIIINIYNVHIVLTAVEKHQLFHSEKAAL